MMWLKKAKKRKEANLQQLRVIISGGGTGGHIFPAIAIANALKELRPDTEILFVGAQGKMEMEKVPAAGYKIEGLWISGLQRKLTLTNLLFPMKVLSSMLKSLQIIRNFRPNVVVGVGGFASGPLLRAALSKNIPALIQEQNSYPGITNKILAPKVNTICVAYDGLEKYFPKHKIILTGNPVRKDIKNLEGKNARGLEHFQLENNQPCILIIGGSLGARTINEAIHENLSFFINNRIQLIWQTGKAYFETAQKAVQNLSYKGIKVFDFIQKMDYAYSAADIVISRAGASSVSELAIVGKPCVLIPSPNVAEDHQTKNAMALVNKNAAILVKDAEAKNDLTNKINWLLQNPMEMQKLSVNISKLALANADIEIATEVIKLGLKK